MSDNAQLPNAPQRIDVYVNKDERSVHVEFKDGDQLTAYTLPRETAILLHRALRDAVHKMDKAKVAK